MFGGLQRAGAMRSAKAIRWCSLAAALIAGIVIGVVAATPRGRSLAHRSNADPGAGFSNLNDLSPEDVRRLIVSALSRLETKQGFTLSDAASADRDYYERSTHNRRDSEQGIRNMRRLLPSAKQMTIETLHEATESFATQPKDWLRVSGLVNRVCKIVRTKDLGSTAAVQDGRPSEILVDSDDAPYLRSDDEALFVLAHELTHIAARSGKLDRFIQCVAEDSNRTSHVTATRDQREDLACDFVGELVLKRFVTLNPTCESVFARISRVLAYETPSERFARAWDDFCASYNGDPGDRDHLSQYQTIRALVALDPDLQSIIPTPTN